MRGREAGRWGWHIKLAGFALLSVYGGLRGYKCGAVVRAVEGDY